MSIEGLFLTCIIDIMVEGHDVATCNVPGAFTQADINKLIHIKLEGEIALLLVRLDPSYQQYATMKNGKPLIDTASGDALLERPICIPQ